MLRLQYASHLRLERLADKIPFPLMIKPAAPFLALAGNIGDPKLVNYERFLDYCSRNWDQTYLVPGHTELGPDVQEWGRRLWFLDSLTKKYENVQFLNRQVMGLPGVKRFCLLGTPLIKDIDAEKQWLLKAKRACVAQGLSAVTLTVNAPTRFWSRLHMSAEEQEILEGPICGAIFDNPRHKITGKWGDLTYVSNSYGVEYYSREAVLDLLLDAAEDLENQEKGPNIILDAAANKGPLD